MPQAARLSTAFTTCPRRTQCSGRLFSRPLFLHFACVTAFAADFSGKWKAQFDTQWGVQNYTYNFQVDGGKLTGKAVSDRGETNISEGKIDGDNISFVEVLSFNAWKSGLPMPAGNIAAYC